MTMNKGGFKSYIFDSMPVAMVTMDADFTITSFNQRAEYLTGYLSQDAVGQTCYEVLHSSLCVNECPLKSVQHSVDAKTGLEAEFVNHYGEHIPVRIGVAALENGEGRSIGYLEVIEDISREKDLEREKNNFLFMVAHDMKSPLLAIQGLIQRLREHHSEMATEQLEKYFKTILDAGEQIETQVSEFLEYSRQATENIRLKVEDADLEKIIDKLIYRHKPRAAEKKINIRTEYDCARQVRADERQLYRVLENLFDNALKFINTNGEVAFCTRETSRETIIQVKDSGPGIDEDELQYIFDAFYQSESNTMGHGLGLAAVKAIVQEHGGRVSVASSPGKGSVFTVRLPRHERPETPENGQGIRKDLNL